MEALYLAEPDKKYQRSFENYVLSYKEVKDDIYYNKYKMALEDFDGYIKDLYNRSRGINVPEGRVPYSTFWLIDNWEVVGVTRVRHQEVETAGHIGYDISPYYRNKGYGTLILKLALEQAAKLGIRDAIVTCSMKNTASRRIIEKNDGQLLGIVFDEEDNENLYRYSVSTKPGA